MSGPALLAKEFLQELGHILTIFIILHDLFKHRDAIAVGKLNMGQRTIDIPGADQLVAHDIDKVVDTEIGVFLLGIVAVSLIDQIRHDARLAIGLRGEVEFGGRRVHGFRIEMP